MILYLVRHGETAYNREGRGLGRADIPLTPEGEIQAARTGARMARERIDHVYSSPLQRALTSARAIAGERALPLDVRDELTELDVGQTEGLLFSEARQLYREFMEAWSKPGGEHVRMPGGESLADLADRLVPFIADLQAHAGDERIAVASHNFVLRVLLCRLLSLDLPSVRSIHLDLASISALDITPERVRVRFLNDTAHLR